MFEGWDLTYTRVVNKPNTDLLKIVATIAMTVDHVNTVVLEAQYVWMTVIGRTVFVIFAFLLAYNYLFHTSDRLRYVWRLVLFAVISQPFYIMAFERPQQLNIFVTLALGIMCAEIFRSRILNAVFLAISAFVVMFSLDSLLPIQIDYGVRGILLTYLPFRYLEQKDFRYLAGWIGVIVLLNWVDDPYRNFLFAVGSLSGASIVYLSTRTTVNLSFIRRYSLLFYLYYPIHLLVLRLLAS